MADIGRFYCRVCQKPALGSSSSAVASRTYRASHDFSFFLQVVTCSGAGSDGSLRIVRNGIGMIGQATIELPGIRGLWSLRGSFEDSFDSFLVLTFVGETRLLAINEDDELEEAEPEGFDADSLVCRSCSPGVETFQEQFKTMLAHRFLLAILIQRLPDDK